MANSYNRIDYRLTQITTALNRFRIHDSITTRKIAGAAELEPRQTSQDMKKLIKCVDKDGPNEFYRITIEEELCNKCRAYEFCELEGRKKIPGKKRRGAETE